MTIINAVILGLIQGIAGFLPISASGHFAIVQNLFGLGTGEEHMLFQVLLKLAGLVALFLVFREELSGLFNDCVTMFTTGDAKLRDKSRLGTRQVLMLAISCVPMLLLLPVYGMLAELESHTVVIGLTMILTGCLLYVADKFLPGKKDGKSISVFDALVIGACHAVAVLPGLSRTAAAIGAGLCCGVDKEYAAKYSLLLLIPTMLCSTLASIIELFGIGVNWAYLPAYLIGTAVALLTAVLSVGILQLTVKKGRFGSFSYYCWGAGVISIFLTALL